jgi:hypothetical protein
VPLKEIDNNNNNNNNNKHYERSSNCELLIISHLEGENRTLHLTQGNMMFSFTET